MSGQEGSGGFLPPQAVGAEPDLGPAAAPEPDVEEASGAAAQMDWGARVARMRNDPGNDAAVAGFVMAAASVVLLFLSSGLSSVLSLALGIAGIVCGLRGRRKVSRGETAKHGGLATASLWTGVTATVFSVAGTIFWAAVIIAGDFHDHFDDDGGNDGLDGKGDPAARAAVVVFTIVGRHLS